MRAFSLAGYAACGFDFNRMRGVTNVDDPTSEDITTERGFRNAVAVLLRIRCSSQTWCGQRMAWRRQCGDLRSGSSLRAQRQCGGEGDSVLGSSGIVARRAGIGGEPPKELHVEHVPSPRRPAGSSAQLPHSSLRLSYLRFYRGRDHEGVPICLHTSVGGQPRPPLHVPPISGPHRHDENQGGKVLGHPVGDETLPGISRTSRCGSRGRLGRPSCVACPW